MEPSIAVSLASVVGTTVTTLGVVVVARVNALRESRPSPTWSWEKAETPLERERRIFEGWIKDDPMVGCWSVYSPPREVAPEPEEEVIEITSFGDNWPLRLTQHGGARWKMKRRCILQRSRAITLLSQL